MIGTAFSVLIRLEFSVLLGLISFPIPALGLLGRPAREVVSNTNVPLANQRTWLGPQG